MHLGRWLDFVKDACAAVERHGGVLHNTAWGTGYWNGQSEETFVATFSGVTVGALGTDLALLAFTYGQECIALLVGQTALVESAERFSSHDTNDSKGKRKEEERKWEVN